MNSFVFSESNRTITVYGYLSDTGEYIGKSDCYIPAGTGLPAYCTHIAPPVAPKGKVVIFNSVSGCWNVVDDHRGKVAYDTKTRQPQTITTLGVLPETLTLLEPQSEFDFWTGKQWKKDNGAERAHLQEKAITQKSQLISEASQRIDILTDKINLGMVANESSVRIEIEQWRKYRALLDEVDPALAPEIEWPVKPE